MKKNRFWIILLVLVLLGATGATVISGMNRGRPVQVDLSRVETMDLRQSIIVAGTLAAGDAEDIPVPATRKVARLHVREGDRVKTGDLLAELDTADLVLQRERLLISMASLEDELAEIQNPTLRSDVANTRSRVSQLTLSLENATRQLREAEEKLAADQALFNAGAIPAATLDASRQNRDNLANSLLQAQQALAAARADASDVTAGKSLQESAIERQLDGIGIDLERVLLQIEDSRIVADMDGDILDLPLEEGRYPMQGSIIRIRDLSRWEAVAYLTQEDALRVSVGQQADIRIKGLPGTWPARVAEIGREAAGEAGSGSRTPKVEVALEISSADPGFASGYDVEVAILTGSADGAAAVVREAVQSLPDGTWRVYSVDTGGDESGTVSGNEVSGSIRAIPVTPGLETDSHVVVGEALPAGTLVVLPPFDTIADGMLVKGTVSP